VDVGRLTVVSARTLVLAAACWLSGALPAAAPAQAARSTVTRWMPNAEPAAWDAANGQIIVNRRGANGLWNAYTILPNATGLKCITCSAPSFPGVGTATNRGASDVSPDGRYVLLVVEKGEHPGFIGGTESDPGRGVYDDLWIATVDGQHAWQLTNLPANPNAGVNWPRFDRTGSQIVWAQMYAAADFNHPFGQWAMKVATVDWSGGTPQLTSTRTYEPESGRFFEPYGFSPDDRRILFASDLTVEPAAFAPSAFNSQIWTIAAAQLNGLRRVSPITPAIVGPFSNYNEFAYYLPGTNQILFARTVEASAGGMDYWTVSAGGGEASRLTLMNQPGSAEYMGYSIAGGLAFDPANPNRFLAGVSHEIWANQLEAVFVTVEAAGSSSVAPSGPSSAAARPAQLPLTRLLRRHGKRRLHSSPRRRPARRGRHHGRPTPRRPWVIRLGAGQTPSSGRQNRRT
jgi:hypothetical protein